MKTLRVIEVFDSLQGEGFWTGVPMTFVRLAGCNAPDLDFECLTWCDTPQAWSPSSGESVEIDELAASVRLPRVCLTGGEPLLQGPPVYELVSRLHEMGKKVHLETNGSLDPICQFDWAVVSPKPPDFVIANGWLGEIDELKFIVGPGFDAEIVERMATKYPGAIVCLQPQWATGSKDLPLEGPTELAISLVMAHPEWRLSLQTHKVLEVR